MNQPNAIALPRSLEFAAQNFLAHVALINKERGNAEGNGVVACAPVDLTLTFDKPQASTVSARLRRVALECVEALEHCGRR